MFKRLQRLLALGKLLFQVLSTFDIKYFADLTDQCLYVRSAKWTMPARRVAITHRGLREGHRVSQ